ncbi:hypothetical protein [Butyricimonas faecihominis]|uniref:hypothetical protein n=1 Tax=Butyricimonas faecihominis TaxID=1472416 RepID=UPI0026DA96E9|nr:hypothetical protein [Butyricimonas faecihominis]
MNFIYDTVSEVMEDINNVKTMSDEEFFKTYAWEPGEREDFLRMLEEDLDELRHEEREVMFIDEWNEEYNQGYNFF